MHGLIIEDHYLVAVGIEMQLRDSGYTSFDIAESEALAITMADRRCPDIIVAEDRLASGSGIEAVRTICANKRIPVIYLLTMPLDLLRPLPDDAVVVGKPYRSDDFRRGVEQAVLTATAEMGTN
jgi:CheY-like chemotaxis protein